MPKNSPNMRSWQVFNIARKYIGIPFLLSVFGKKNARCINYWCEDPKFTKKNDEAFDPILGVKRLFTCLDDHGFPWVVRAAVRYMIAETSITEEFPVEILADMKPTMSEEMLADYPAIATLHKAINDGSDLAVVEQFKREAIAEIERTVAKFRCDNGW